MSNITANEVKVLRDRTGAGMMDCKKALVACDGDLEASIDWLRKKGLAAASKKADRVASEGVIAVYSNDGCATLVELNAETDFVARNELFQKYAETIAKLACENCADVESLKNLPYPGSDKTVSEELTNLIAIIGENMSIRRVNHSKVDGVVATYVHNKLSDNLGKIGVTVSLKTSCSCEKAVSLGKQIAMHIAASNPQSLSVEDLDPALLARERDIVSEQARSTGKPEAVIEKMVEGRIRKFYEEVVLLEQSFVINPDKKVKEIVTDAANECSCDLKLVGFTKFVLGEGIEKKQVDFASEVAAQLV